MKEALKKLHNQIILALIAGIIFGALFKVDPHKLSIQYFEEKDKKTSVVSDWNKLYVINSAGDTSMFMKSNQMEIIAESRKLLNIEKSVTVIVTESKIDDEVSKVHLKRFEQVVSIKKQSTIATKIKWIGDIFIRLLNMIAIPLVLASLIVGAASLGDIKKFARMGGKTIAFYISTTAFAITIGLILANIIQPGEQMPPDTKNKLLSVYQGDIEDKLQTQFEFDVTNEIVNIVPKNPFDAMANGNMLQIVFFAVCIGIILTMINKEKAAPVTNFFDSLSEAMIKLVDVIMYIAPIGVFALISATIGEFGFEILTTLIWYTLTVLLGLIIHVLGTYGIILKVFTKLKFKDFFLAIRRAQAIAFSTSSSAATLPVTIECCQENLGISKSTTSFVLPLGATINMDGTALYQGVAAVFIAQVFGFDLNLTQQLTIVLTAVLASIGTAPVPGVGLIMLIIILRSVGIPQEGIALILGVDRIIDMCRTIANITGDALAAAVIATSEKEELKINLADA